MTKTISDRFQSFRNRIQSFAGERAKAISHKESIKSCVANNFNCYSLFETGSFGNGTGVRHYSDTDYFAPIPAAALSSNSSTALRKVKEALQYTFPRTEGIAVDSPAVQIPFGQYASETIEVIPCSFSGMSQTPIGSFPQYEIPDGNSGWLRASPEAHTRYVKKVDEGLKGKLKPLITFIKGWKYMNNVPLLSFYLELRVTRFMESRIILSYDHAIFQILEELHRVKLAGMLDPMGVSGAIPACIRSGQMDVASSKLYTALTRAEKAYNARAKGNDADAAHYWDLFFGREFIF